MKYAWMKYPLKQFGKYRIIGRPIQNGIPSIYEQKLEDVIDTYENALIYAQSLKEFKQLDYNGEIFFILYERLAAP